MVGEISFVGAFVGGLVSLLPACGPALVPAFFAYTFSGNPRDAVRATVAFAVGFSLLFVPFSLGVHGIFDMLSVERRTVEILAGCVLVVIGAVQLLGISFPRLYVSRGGGKSLGFVGLGLVFGLVSAACIAPVLGGIITLAAVEKTWLRALWLLFAFELGMFLPLLLVSLGVVRASFLERLGSKRITVTFGEQTYGIPALRLISAVLFLIIGIGFVFPKAHRFILPEPLRQYFLQIAQ